MNRQQTTVPVEDQPPKARQQRAELTDFSRLADLFRDIEQELDAATSPHRVALGDLGIDRNGFVSRPYSDIALSHWDRLLKQDPDDLVTLHHCAIANHAKAIDLEATNNPHASDEHWQEAAAHWAALMARGDFWESIARTVDEPTDSPAIADLRRRLPTRLLRVHLDIAHDDRTPTHRVQFHIDFIRSSELTREDALREAREQVYDRFSRRFPGEIWQPGHCDPKIAADVSEMLVEFLGVDLENYAASVDLLRFQMRLMNSRLINLAAQGQEQGDTRDEILREMANDAKRYGPYIAPLAAHLEDVDKDIAEDFVMWHRLMGEVHEALESHAEALKYYDAPPHVEGLKNSELVRCRNGGAEALASLALRLAQRGRRDALRHVSALENRPNPTVKAYLYAGYACLALEEFDRAKRLCDFGELTDTGEDELGSQHTASEEQAKLQLTELRKDLLARRAIKQAERSMKDGNIVKALRCLDEAKAAAPNPIVLWLRAQCLEAKGQYKEADFELDEVERLLKESPQELEIVQEQRKKWKLERLIRPA